MKTNKLFLLMALAVMAAFSSCKEKEAEQADEAVKVNVTTVSLHKVDQLSTFTATIKGDVVNQIAPAIPARIRRIYVEVGQRVNKGQTLAEMDRSTYEQQRVQLETLERDFKRYEELSKVGGIAPQQLEQAKAQLDVLRTAIANLRENTVLVSPISGIVTARNYDEGDVFSGLPLFTVQQINRVKAIINVSESYYPHVKEGMPVDVKLDIYKDETFSGKVKLIHPTINPATHTFTCEVEIPNPDLKVRPGMFARVTLNFGEEDRLLVPDYAVVKQVGADTKYIYTVHGNVAKYNAVQLGRRLNDRYEVLSGINNGDVIVTSGQPRLIDGAKVQIIKD